MLEILNIGDFVHREFPELRALWFYAGTSEDLFASFPAHELTLPFKPTGRPWYKEAMKSPDISGFSTAYIDAASNMPVRTFWYRYSKSGTADMPEVNAVVAIDFMMQLSEKATWRNFIIEFLLIFFLGSFAVYLGLWLAYQRTDTFYRAAVQRIRDPESWRSLSQYVMGFFGRK